MVLIKKFLRNPLNQAHHQSSHPVLLLFCLHMFQSLFCLYHGTHGRKKYYITFQCGLCLCGFIPYVFDFMIVSVYLEIADFGSRQGRRDFLKLRRSKSYVDVLKILRTQYWTQRCYFPDGHCECCEVYKTTPSHPAAPVR